MSAPLPDRHESHVVSPLLYLGVFASLMVLTFVTVAASRYDFGPWNTVVAMAIAVLKATLVILFFMHVKWSSRLVRLMVMAAFLWLALLIAGTLSDYDSRGRVNPAVEKRSPTGALLEDR
jgi:cytochrome c oxidase subunit 4